MPLTKQAKPLNRAGIKQQQDLLQLANACYTSSAVTSPRLGWIELKADSRKKADEYDDFFGRSEDIATPHLVGKA